MRLNDLKDLKKITVNNVERLKQTLLEMEELKKTTKLKMKQLKKFIQNLPKENPFDFTEYLEMQEEENEIYFGLFFELAEENRIIQSSTSKHSHRRYGKIEEWVFLRIIILLWVTKERSKLRFFSRQ